MLQTLPVTITQADPRPLHRQIYDQIRDLILSGRLAPGIRLPSSRSLAQDLGVSRNTVIAAYDQLTAEDFLEGRQGAGSFVSDNLTSDALVGGAFTTPGPDAEAGPPALSGRAETLLALEGTGRPVNRAFRAGYPDTRLFPFETWGRLLARVWRRPDTGLTAGTDPGGFEPLRQAIADYLHIARGVRCEVDQVIITSGAQQALALTALALTEHGDSVFIEDPGFPGVRGAFVGSGLKPVPVPVDSEGIDIEWALKSAPETRLLCAAPSLQFPLCVTMSLQRRLQLIDWAERHGGWIVEDDYDSEFRYSGRPLASLQGLDPNGRVIYVGSFSKVMFPALRVGYLVAPPDLAQAIVGIRAIIEGHPSIIAQQALAAFLTEGHFSSHLRRMRKIYAARQAVLVAAAAQHLDGLLAIARADAGMSLVAGLAAPLARRMDDREASARARALGVDAAPVSGFHIGRPDYQGLFIGYAAVNEPEIEAGVRKLREALT